jgi:hypothetical protein
MARFGFSFQDLNDQSTLKSLMSDVRVTWEEVTPIRSKTGEAGMLNSLGLTLPALSSCCARPEIEKQRNRKEKKVTAVMNLIDQHFVSMKFTTELSKKNTSMGEFEKLPEKN